MCHNVVKLALTKHMENVCNSRVNSRCSRVTRAQVVMTRVTYPTTFSENQWQQHARVLRCFTVSGPKGNVFKRYLIRTVLGEPLLKDVFHGTAWLLSAKNRNVTQIRHSLFFRHCPSFTHDNYDIALSSVTSYLRLQGADDQCSFPAKAC